MTCSSASTSRSAAFDRLLDRIPVAIRSKCVALMPISSYMSLKPGWKCSARRPPSASALLRYFAAQLAPKVP